MQIGAVCICMVNETKKKKKWQDERVNEIVVFLKENYLHNRSLTFQFVIHSEKKGGNSHINSRCRLNCLHFQFSRIECKRKQKQKQQA